MSSTEPSHLHFASPWGILLMANSVVLAGVVGALIWLTHMFEIHDRVVRNAQPAITPTLRALELENSELRNEVGNLKVELHKKQVRLAALAPSRPQACPVGKPPAGDAESTEPAARAPTGRYVSPLVGKMHVRRFGQS